MTHVQTISPVRRLLNDLNGTNFETLKPTAARAMRASCIGTLRAAGAGDLAASLDSTGGAIPSAEWFETVKTKLIEMSVGDKLAELAANASKVNVSDELAELAANTSKMLAAGATVKPTVEPATASQGELLVEVKPTKAARKPKAAKVDSIAAAAEAVAAAPVEAVAAAPVEAAPAIASPEPATAAPATVPAPAETGAYTLPAWVKPAVIEAAAKDGLDLRRATGNVQLQVAIALSNMAASRDALDKVTGLDLPEHFGTELRKAQAMLRELAHMALVAKSRVAPRAERANAETAKPITEKCTVRLSSTGLKDALLVESVGGAEATGTVVRCVYNEDRKLQRVIATFNGTQVVLRARDVAAV